jgi:nucleoid DNA-binding protein
MKMAGLKDIAKKVGLNPLKLETGASVDVMELIEEMFMAIVDECRSKEGSVRIKDFGTFSARLNKGRKLKTPLMEDGEVEFGDMLLLKFHQSTVSKKRLNDGGAVEDWGGKYIEKKMRPSDIKKAEAAEKRKAEVEKKKKDIKPKKASKAPEDAVTETPVEAEDNSPAESRDENVEKTTKKLKPPVSKKTKKSKESSSKEKTEKKKTKTKKAPSSKKSSK